MNYFKFITFFVGLLILQNTQSQELFPVRNFAPDVYRSETQNWGITQSEQGVIYVANNKGLLEFNGANWKLYPSPNHTIIRSVCANGNRIYTGCYMEFGYWDKDELFNLKYTSLSKKIKNKLLEDEHFWNIICYGQWTLFQSLHRIYIYDNRSNTFQIIASKTNLPKMFAAGNQIYFQKINEGVFKLENGKPVLLTDFPVLKNNILINIFLFGNKMLMQTQENGFFVYDNGTVSEWQTNASAKIKSLSVYSSRQLRDGSFVLGTIGEGVYFLSAEGKISKHLEKINGLQNNTVLAVFEDADHNVWLGLDNGISVLNYRSAFRTYYDAHGVFGSVYAAAYYQGYLYLGTNQGLFFRPLIANEDFKLINGTKGQVWALKVIDNTLFCGHNAGTFTVKGNNAELICKELGTWDIKPIENNPNLLLQGNYEGLNVLEKQGETWRWRNKIEGFNISSRFFELMPDNQIFVSHEYKGVYRLTISSDYQKVTRFEEIPDAPLSFNAGIIKHRGTLLYFAESGLYKYDGQKKGFQKDEKMTKLILDDDAYISGKMVQDGNQTLWMFTKNNITAVSSGKLNSEPNIHRVPLSLPVRENVVGFENLLHLGNDMYLLGTSNGYMLFNLNEIADKEYVIQINSIEKNKSNQTAANIPLLAKNYRLKYGENNIKFSYSVPAYDKFTPVKYQYKLEGIYDDWADWTDDSQAVFKNLPSGSYTFQVRAKVGNKLTANIASYHFSVAKPWYASWWMMLIYVMMFGVLLWFINRLYKRRYDKKTEKINQEKLLMQLKNEKEIIKLRNDNLNNEVESVNRELASTTMAVIKKNELLNTLRVKLQQTATDGASVKSALKIIDENLDKNSDWETFQQAFNNSDRDFLKKLKELHPALTPNDLKLCVYLRLNLSSKEIAPMLNISPQSVEIKRFRLRKKMELNHEENLTDYILGI